MKRYVTEYASSVLRDYEKHLDIPAINEKYQKISKLLTYTNNGLVTEHECIWCIANIQHE